MYLCDGNKHFLWHCFLTAVKLSSHRVSSQVYYGGEVTPWSSWVHDGGEVTPWGSWVYGGGEVTPRVIWVHGVAGFMVAGVTPQGS